MTLTTKDAMLAVLTGCGGLITAREFFARTMRLMNETGDPDQVARECGLEPDTLLRPGKAFTPTFRVIESPAADCCPGPVTKSLEVL